MRKKALETTVALILILMPPMLVTIRVDETQAFNTGNYDPSSKWWLKAHNWVFLNAVELLKRDQFEAEADIVSNETTMYLQDVINGLTDADEGSNHLSIYRDLGQWQSGDKIIDMRDLGGLGLNGGGLSHFYDPWTHLGIGITEDPRKCQALLYTANAVVGLLAGPLGLIPASIWSAFLDEKILDWSNWFGRNAGEAAVRAFDRAIDAWNAGYQRKAMYYLGMVLHLIGDVAGIPYHAVNWLLGFQNSNGHSDSETYVDTQLSNALESVNNWVSAVEKGKTPGETRTMYNIDWSDGSRDHGIYLGTLRDRSDGVYIAGDPIGAGHIYQVSNRVQELIDFAAHESMEWFPLFNDFANWGSDLDDWWEAPNYIETGDLHMTSPSKPRDSRLIFHLEGVDWVTADFQWAIVNDEAIDMENLWGTDLGYVEAYEGYHSSIDHRIGGPWVCDYWNGPEPSARDTLQIRTVVNHGLDGDYWDDDCDGWQIGEIRYFDSASGTLPGYPLHPELFLTDPLLLQLNENEQFIRSDGSVGYLSDLVWDDPFAYPYDGNVIATVHLLDLSSKLCAGMIKYFFEEVHLPIRTPPKSFIIPVDEPYDPYVHVSPNITYTTTDRFFIGAEIGRTVWSDAQNKYVEEIVPENVIYKIHYVIDGDEGAVETYPLHSCGTYISVIDDGKQTPHTIEFWATGKNTRTGDPFDEESHHTKIFVVDKSPPQVTFTVGEPSRLIDGVWHVTADTPITVTASDINGSGVKGFYYWIAERGGQHSGDWVVPSELGSSWEDCLTYQGPFTLGGKEVTQQILVPFRPAGTTGTLDLFYRYLTATTREVFLGLQPGEYEIGYYCFDNLWPAGGYEGDPEKGGTHYVFQGGDVEGKYPNMPYHVHGFHVTLDDSWVDMRIDPNIQNIRPGSSGAYNISITNNYEAYNVYDIALEGLDPTWYALSQTQITIGPRQTENITLTVSPPNECLFVKAYKFNVTASMQKPIGSLGPWEKDTQEGVLRVFPDWPADPKPPGNIKITAPSQIQVALGVTVERSFQIENLDTSRDNCIHLSIDVTHPNLVSFNWTKLDLFIPAGQIATIPLTIDVSSKAGGPEHELPLMHFDLKATSLTKYPKASDTSVVYLSQDVLSPFTIFMLGRQTIVDVTGRIFATSEAVFSLDASDGDEGVGIATVNYRIYNSTYDTGLITTIRPIPIILAGLSDGTYIIEYYSTDKGGNIEPSKITPVILDNTGPTAAIFNPPIGWALQDGVTFTISVADAGSGVRSVNASVRVADGGEGQPCGFEDLPATFDEPTGKWTLFFDTLQLPDGYYTVLIETDDNLGNIGSPVVVPYSIRNWAVIELLPSTPKNKAGRTMPVKFSLRVAAAVDPSQPFVYNEELTIKIYVSNDSGNILQTSAYGNAAQDYRIDIIGEKYITNFKTLPTPKQYTVSINRNTFQIGNFDFRTVA